MSDRVLAMLMRFGGAAVCLALVAAGCSKQEQNPTPPPPREAVPVAGAPAAPNAPAAMEFCDFKGGPESAPVKVVAYYPGRHENTLEAIKRLLETFPGQVSVEIVDWRRPEGLKRRDESGLTCAGITINGKNAFDLEIDGKTAKVMFVRGIDGDWTEQDLVAAVKQELNRAAKP